MDRRSVTAVVASAVLALGLAACGGEPAEDDSGQATPEFDAANGEIYNPSDEQGGTLRLAISEDWDSVDPGDTYYGLSWNLLRLYGRSLTMFKPAPGDASAELVGDLAEGLGVPSEDARTWTYTLREGLKFEDGTPITSADVKYAVLRSIDKEVLVNGPTYFGDFLDLGDFESVFDNPDADTDAIETPDERTIVFHLKEPFGGFDYFAMLPATVPVPKDQDTGVRYKEHVVSSGPYMFEEYREGTGFTLVRNPNWDPATDPNRPAYPDRIEFYRIEDPAVMTNDLINDQGEIRNTILLDLDIAATFVQQVMTDPELSQRVASGPMGAVRYLVINTQRIENVECRQALAYAMNKRKFRSVFGGSLLGDIATTMIPPNLEAHQQFDHYGHLENPDGQPDRALEILDQADEAGIECPDEITYVHPANPLITRLSQTVVESFREIGIHVETTPVAESEYGRVVLGERHGDWDLTWIGWIPDWPNGSSVIPPLFDGRNLGPGSVNLSYLNDERINEMIDNALQEPDLQRQYPLWGELDSEIQKLAATIPLLYNNALRMHGSNVRGAFIRSRYGMPDLSAMGLADPSLSGSPEE